MHYFWASASIPTPAKTRQKRMGSATISRMGSAIALTTTLSYLFTGAAAKADSLPSFCAYYLRGESQPAAAMPCDFSERQGRVDISWDDGVYNQFELIGDQSNVFTDQQGQLVYQQGTNGPADVIFEMEAGTVIEVYWISL